MNIKVKGLSSTKFGELWDKSLINLVEEATNAALTDAKLKITDIDAAFIGTMLSGETTTQSQMGSIFASLYGVNIPGTRVEAACASGGVAIYQAVQFLKANPGKKVLVVGVEKMTDLCASKVTDLLMQAASQEERDSGANFPSLYALVAQAHMREFGTTREQMALCSVMAHQNALSNEKAQFRKKITVEDVVKATPVAEPLTLLDCSPITDGAAALILTTEAPSKSKKEAFIVSSAFATDTLSLAQRESVTTFKSTQTAAKAIFADSGITHKDINFLEVHDCFSIGTIVALEDIGFVKKGKGGKAIEKIFKGDKSLPQVNVSGGLKACGHPVGATGVKQVVELAARMRNSTGYGLAQNIGGTGASCVMNLVASSDTLI